MLAPVRWPLGMPPLQRRRGHGARHCTSLKGLVVGQVSMRCGHGSVQGSMPGGRQRCLPRPVGPVAMHVLHLLSTPSLDDSTLGSCCIQAAVPRGWQRTPRGACKGQQGFVQGVSPQRPWAQGGVLRAEVACQECGLLCARACTQACCVQGRARMCIFLMLGCHLTVRRVHWAYQLSISSIFWVQADAWQNAA